MALLDVASGFASGDASLTSRFERLQLVLLLNVNNTSLHQSLRAGLRGLRQVRWEHVQVNIDTGRQQGFSIKDRNGFEAFFPKRAATTVLLVGQSRQRFFQRLHEPAQVLQTLSQRLDSRRVLDFIFNPSRDRFIVGQIQRLEWVDHHLPSYDLVGIPLLGVVRIQPQQDVQMVIRNREDTDGHCAVGRETTEKKCSILSPAARRALENAEW